MLREVCRRNGASLYIYGKEGSFGIVECYLIDDVFLVVFENGKCVVECFSGGKSVVIEDFVV